MTTTTNTSASGEKGLHVVYRQCHLDRYSCGLASGLLSVDALGPLGLIEF